jgi:hypothetical protein
LPANRSLSAVSKSLKEQIRWRDRAAPERRFQLLSGTFRLQFIARPVGRS